MENKEFETAGQRIKFVRMLLKMRQSDFAGSLSVSSKTMSDCEQGKSNPNFVILSQLRKVYNVNLDFIVLGLGDPFLTEDKEVHDPSDQGVIKHREILINTELRNFLQHLLNSKIVMINSLDFFSKLYRREHRAISKEMEEAAEK